MKLNFFLLLILFSWQSHAQPTQEFLDSLYDEIQFLIGDEWYLEPTKDGFQVTFCRSCAKNYKHYKDSSGFILRERSITEFFAEDKIDSIAFVPLVSSYHNLDAYSEEERHAFLVNKYKPEGILRFEVRIEKPWSEKKIEQILAQNEELKDSILREPLYKSNMSIFADYRYWLPGEYWNRRTKSLNFYFERLPYKSEIMDASILIDPSLSSFFARYMLVDKEDAYFYKKQENLLMEERNRTLKIIALALGIHDYKIL
ncbi:MAG: hypothetical protein NXI10_00230 [bacterium]|nr:hypothetical protein [bacterium]